MPRYWVIAPYPLEPHKEEEWEKAWQFDLRNGVISIGWGIGRDASRYNEKQLEAEIKRTHPSESPNSIARIFGMVWKFYNEIKPGDIVIARRGRKVIAAVGTVTKAAYYHRKKSLKVQAEYQFTNFIDVCWHDTPKGKEFEQMVFGMQTLHEIPEAKYKELVGLDNFSPESTPEAEDISKPPNKVQSTTYRILRDTELARGIKKLHNHRCQVCHSAALKLADGILYAEAHHIKPLGSPHGGPDVPGNVICVCPNCHVLLDYGATPLDASKLRSSPSHRVEQEYIEYHNTYVFRKKAT